MDGLVALDFDAEPAHMRMIGKAAGYVAHHVLNEGRPRKGVFGHKLLILALEQRIDGRRAGRSAISMKSSIQQNPRIRTAMRTSARWLCAPSRLMAFEQGHTVITGTVTSSRNDGLPSSGSSPVSLHS